jgi:uncharacterized protein
MFDFLDFCPLPGFSSPHWQMMLSTYGPTGKEPDSKEMIVTLKDGDRLSCHVSSPKKWKPNDKTLVLIHGLGGSHNSCFMIRIARKAVELGLRVVRINLRGAGTGAGLAHLPYNCGTSEDVVEVLEVLKKKTPNSPIILIGFSMSGNIVIKMAGELGRRACQLLSHVIAVCPLLDLRQTVQKFELAKNWLYHKYYFEQIVSQGKIWVKNLSICTLKEFDDKITVPLWGYKNRRDYYKQCSSYHYIPYIFVPCEIIFAQDDPFIDYTRIKKVRLGPETHVWLTAKGSHVGFIGGTSKQMGYYWLDQLLLSWIWDSW